MTSLSLPRLMDLELGSGLVVKFVWKTGCCPDNKFPFIPPMLSKKQIKTNTNVLGTPASGFELFSFS